MPSKMQEDPLFCEAVKIGGRQCESGRELLQLRRSLLEWLEDLDSSLTVQWAGVNTAKTTSAGLAVAAAVTIFFAPPVGIGLGIASAGAGVATTVGDWIANKVKDGNFKEKMAEDSMKAQEFSKLAEELKAITKQLALKYKVPEPDLLGVVIAIVKELAKHGLDVTKVTFNTFDLCANLSKAGKVVVEGGGRASITVMEGAYDMAKAGRATGDGLKAGAEVTASAAAKTLSVLGAVVSVGDAVYSWITTSPTQQSVRKAIEAVRESIKDLSSLYE